MCHRWSRLQTICQYIWYGWFFVWRCVLWSYRYGWNWIGGKILFFNFVPLRQAQVKLPVCFAFEINGVDDGGPGTLKLFNGWPWWPRFGASTDNPGAYVTLGLLQEKHTEFIVNSSTHQFWLNFTCNLMASNRSCTEYRVSETTIHPIVSDFVGTDSDPWKHVHGCSCYTECVDTVAVPLLNSSR